jgi:hypothetical protein
LEEGEGLELASVEEKQEGDEKWAAELPATHPQVLMVDL